MYIKVYLHACCLCCSWWMLKSVRPWWYINTLYISKSKINSVISCYENKLLVWLFKCCKIQGWEINSTWKCVQQKEYLKCNHKWMEKFKFSKTFNQKTHIQTIRNLQPTKKHSTCKKCSICKKHSTNEEDLKVISATKQ